LWTDYALNGGGDGVSDQIIDQWLADGRIALYQRLMDSELPPLNPEVFKAALDVERRNAVDLVATLADGKYHVLGSLVDSKRPPDPMFLARLDLLIEAATGKAPGLEALLRPWSKQVKALAEFIEERNGAPIAYGDLGELQVDDDLSSPDVQWDDFFNAPGVDLLKQEQPGEKAKE
jgi:hypothetical protein